MTVLGFVLYGSIVILPIWLQTLLGYPAMHAGLDHGAARHRARCSACRIIGMIAAAIRCAQGSGAGLASGRVLHLSVGAAEPGRRLSGICSGRSSIQGFGLGMIFVPLTTISMDPVPRESMGNATSLFNLMRNLGGSVGIAMVAMMNTRFQQKYTAILGEHVNSSSPQSEQMVRLATRDVPGERFGPGLGGSAGLRVVVRNGAASSRDARICRRVLFAHSRVPGDDPADSDHEKAEGCGRSGRSRALINAKLNVYNYLHRYTLMRTNIVIDDKLMRDTLRATGLKTKREAVEEGLRTLLRLSKQGGDPPAPRQTGLAGRSQRDEERQLILVDSSVWIDYFKGTITAQTEKLDKLLGHEPLAIGDLILTEVLQGFADERDFNEARKMLTSLMVVELGGQEIAIQAAKNFRALRNLGVTVRKTIDTVIATRCIESGYDLLHNDRDFDPFAKHLGLRVVA